MGETDARGQMNYMEQSVIYPAPDVGYQDESLTAFRPDADNAQEGEASSTQAGLLSAGSSEDRAQLVVAVDFRALGAVLWLLGIGGMLICSVVSLLRLRKSLRAAVHERENIYRCSEFSTAFVYGILRPRIYLPEGLTAREEDFVLLHEQIHIRRRDPIWRLLAWTALCLHWFNPLVWLAFALSGQDMEMACDEAVLAKMGNGIKKEYSAALLALAGERHGLLSGVPLSFSEEDTGKRIRNVLRYRCPGRIAAAFLAAACAAAAFFLLANPSKGEEETNAAVQYAPASQYTEEAQHTEEALYTPADGQASIVVYSLSNDLPGIAEYNVSDEYYPGWDWENNRPQTLYFAENCKFYRNRSMSGVEYEEITYEEYAGYIENDGSQDIRMPMRITIRDGEIQEAYLESPWASYGICYAQPARDNSLEMSEETLGMGMEEILDTYYTLVRSVQADAADAAGMETVSIYTGNTGDEESGYVLIQGADGELLCSMYAGGSRVVWNNIYLGERDGTPFLMTVHIEDRYDYGNYNYYVFRLDEEGELMPIAGSSFEFGEGLLYDDEIFGQWVDEMTSWLADSEILLSTQEGELRTEPMSDADRYNYDTLGGSPRNAAEGKGEEG